MTKRQKAIEKQKGRIKNLAKEEKIVLKATVLYRWNETIRRTGGPVCISASTIYGENGLKPKKYSKEQVTEKLAILMNKKCINSNRDNNYTHTIIQLEAAKSYFKQDIFFRKYIPSLWRDWRKSITTILVSTIAAAIVSWWISDKEIKAHCTTNIISESTKPLPPTDPRKGGEYENITISKRYI